MDSGGKPVRKFLQPTGWGNYVGWRGERGRGDLLQISVSRLNKRTESCVLLCMRFKSFSSQILSSIFGKIIVKRHPPTVKFRKILCNWQTQRFAQFEQLVRSDLLCAPSTTRSVNVTRQTATSHNEVRMMNISLYFHFDALNDARSYSKHERKAKR